MSDQEEPNFKMTTPTKRESERTVEERLRNVVLKLAEVDSNTEMFRVMIRDGVATNEVRSFVSKQTAMKRTTNVIDKSVVRSIMRSKLRDSCAYATRLRQRRGRLKEQLYKKHIHHKHQAIKVLSRLNAKGKEYRRRCDNKNWAKLSLCRAKQQRLDCMDQAPREAKKYLENVNVFAADKVTPEVSVGPMICHKSIKLSEDEKSFLEKGPRYMLRQDLNASEFLVEVEKMIAKSKYQNQEDNGKNDTGNTSDMSDMSDARIEAEAEKEAARCRMVYDKQTRRFDMGNLRATDYKYNRYVHLPKAKSAENEALHEMRKVESLKAFHKVKSSLDRDQSGTNLTKSEQRGLKSLQKRLRAGEIVITETDKSK